MDPGPGTPQYLCCNCVGDSFLSAEIKTKGTVASCEFCSSSAECLPISEVSERVDEVFRANFRLAEYAYGGYSGDYADGIISDMMGVDFEIAKAVLNHLARLYWRDSSDGAGFYYADDEKYDQVEVGSLEYSWMWEEFCHSIIYVSRFFDDRAASYLEEIFSGIDRHQTAAGMSAVRTVDPESEHSQVFRGRLADSSEDLLEIYLNPHTELGPPPAHLASAGRMNPAGIPAFYGAFSRETCAAELRPAVGAIVASGAFEITRPIKVLDLTVLDQHLLSASMFDPGYRQDSDQKSFLHDFHRQVRKPILPQEQDLQYLPTQAVAEFLSNRFKPRLDGVIYASALTGGENLNIALFNHAARVEVPATTPEMIRSRPPLRGYFEHDSFVIQDNSQDGHAAQSDPLGVGRDYAHVFGGLMDLHHRSDGRVNTLRYVERSVELRRVENNTVSTSLITVLQ